MIDPTRRWHTRFVRMIRTAGIPLALSLAPTAPAQEAAPIGTPTEMAVTAPANRPLTLPECLSLALQRQPTLAAAHASLAAAEEGSRSLDETRIPAAIVHELPFRRKQARLGVQINTAGVQLAEYETIYAVTRTYYTVIYARQQEQVARQVVAHLQATHDVTRRVLESGASREVTANTLDRVTVYLRLAQARQVQTAEGVDRALAALKEAIGLGPDCPLQIPDERLPESQVTPQREAIICLALARRPELVQANAIAEVIVIEIDAQGSSMRHRMPTFAMDADLHARPIPQGIADTEYRPGAIGPEMPPELAGSRAVRMELARAYSARAAAVVDKTRNLIGLEADDTFRRWEEATRKLAQTRDAVAKGTKLAENMRRDYQAQQKVKAEDVVNAEVLAAQAEAQFNETLYQQILALAALERVTAGGFSAGLAGAPPAKLPAAPAQPAPRMP
jgi:outer membrane protein TolC